MRWLNWIPGLSDNDQSNDKDVNAEVAAAKIKAAAVRKSRVEAEERTEEYREDVNKLVVVGIANHFGESITLGMMMRRQHGT